MTKFRILPPEEYEKLRPTWESQGIPMPAPECPIRIVVGEDETGKIILTLALHLQAHLDNFWIDADSRGRVDWRRAMEMMENTLGDKKGVHVYVATGSAQVMKMAEKVGFKKSEFPLMFKEY